MKIRRFKDCLRVYLDKNELKILAGRYMALYIHSWLEVYGYPIKKLDHIKPLDFFFKLTCSFPYFYRRKEKPKKLMLIGPRG